MVSVTTRRDSTKRLSSLSASGHSGWAQHGEDVVCAAVSAIVQTAWLGLREVAHVAVDARTGEGTLDLRWDAHTGGEATQAIVETAEIAIEHLARQYPDHVRLVRETDSQAP
ncbi:MAG: ribosomal-processing cysteine protease Prp [Candidatus Eremiobacteraeota bacterium]|nr:ribosomal-processing cysteine protease Prp [Candidatus Eremiobacteraeota bacterium]